MFTPSVFMLFAGEMLVLSNEMGISFLKLIELIISCTRSCVTTSRVMENLREEAAGKGKPESFTLK